MDSAVVRQDTLQVTAQVREINCLRCMYICMLYKMSMCGRRAPP